MGDVLNIVCVGEVMAEFVPVGDYWQQALAGDSYNTAIYLQRAGYSVDYLTLLGDDFFSQAVIKHLEEEGIGTTLVRALAGRQLGLYCIQNDESGERTFNYWRESSPARALFDQSVILAQCPDVLYLSGITLAVMRSGLRHLLELLEDLKQRGCRVVFDPNYRASLWDDQEQAQYYYRQLLPYCDCVLPTLEDDMLLWGIDSIEACKNFYETYPIDELVIKAPQLYCHVFYDDEQLVSQAAEVVAADTTGAGDAFNAGYLAARYLGQPISVAIQQGQALSAQVVQHLGAILPKH